MQGHPPHHLHPQRFPPSPYGPPPPHAAPAYPHPYPPHHQQQQQPPQVPQGESVWKTNKAPDGRVYYYNSFTRQTTWDKPYDLKTPFEKALSDSPWKEHSAPDGRKYFYNVDSKYTTWEMPPEYRDMLKKFKPDSEDAAAQKPDAQATSNAPDAASSSSPAPPSSSGSKPSEASDAGVVTAAGPSTYSTDGEPAASDAAAATAASTQNQGAIEGPAIPSNLTVPLVLDFKTKEEAEIAFRKMLVDSGIDYNWTWEDVIRKTYANPFYRSLKTLNERKETFDKWCTESRMRNRELKRAKIDADTQTLRKLFESSSEIDSTSTYKKVVELFKDNAEFMGTDEENRRIVLAEYVEQLAKAEKEEEDALRKENTIKIKKIFKRLPITLTTPWKEAQSMYTKDILFVSDERLQRMQLIDALVAFEDHIQVLEAQARQERSHRTRADFRLERQRRDGLRQLLSELRESGAIHAKAKWKQLFPLIKDDPRFLATLGQPGSSPLDLFWDLVTSFEEKYRAEKRFIADLARNTGDDIQPDTTLNQFIARHARELSGIDPTNLRLIFDDLHARVVLRAKEEKRYQERKLRRNMDAFKSMLKRVSGPSIKVDNDWESVRARVKDRDEYAALDEPHRVEVFDRFITRLKEKKLEQQQRVAEAAAAGDGEEGEVLETEGGDDSEEVEEQEESYRRRRSGRDGKSGERRRHGRSRRRSGSVSSDVSDHDRDRDRTRDRERERERERDRTHSSTSKRKDRAVSETDETDDQQRDEGKKHRRDKRARDSESSHKDRDRRSRRESKSSSPDKTIHESISFECDAACLSKLEHLDAAPAQRVEIYERAMGDRAAGGNGAGMRASKENVSGSQGNLAGSKSNISGSKSNLAGSKSNLLGSKSNLLGSKSNLLGSKSNLLGSKSNLLGSRANLAAKAPAAAAAESAPANAVVYENTFKLKPDKKFQTLAVRHIIKEVLTTRLNKIKYEHEKVPELIKAIADEILMTVKKLEFDRYKIVVDVNIGEFKGQGIKVASRAVWDTTTDSYASASFKNGSLFAVAMVFGCYYE